MNQSLLTPPKAQLNVNPLLAAPKKKKVESDDTVGTNLVDGLHPEYRNDGKHLLDQNCPRIYGSQNIKNDVIIVQDLVTYHRYYICLTCWWGDFFSSFILILIGNCSPITKQNLIARQAAAWFLEPSVNQRPSITSSFKTLFR